MTKPARQAEPDSDPNYPPAPWSCRHHADHSDIEVYCAALDGSAIIGAVHHAPGIDAMATANFIVGLVNNHGKTEHLIDEMTSALEICLESRSIDWASEHDASLALRLARERAERGN